MKPRVKICKRLECKWLDTHIGSKGKPVHMCTRNRRLGPVVFDLLYSCPSGFKEQRERERVIDNYPVLPGFDL